jgi:hypothetical protein
MNWYHLSLVLCLFVFNATPSFAQLLDPVGTVFGSDQPSKIILRNGTELEGAYVKHELEGNLLSTVTFLIDGQEKVFDASQASRLELAPAKGGGAMTLLYMSASINRAKNTKSDSLWQGQLYVFEGVQVPIYSDTVSCFLQVLNTDFDKRIKLYYDPLGGVEVSFGPFSSSIYPSFFVGWQGEVFRLKRSDYKSFFEEALEPCETFDKKYRKAEWDEINHQVHFFTEHCD